MDFGIPRSGVSWDRNNKLIIDIANKHVFHSFSKKKFDYILFSNSEQKLIINL